MTTYHQFILIKALPERVFSEITAFEKISTRSKLIIESKIITEPPVGIGTKTQITIKLKTGNTDTWVEEVCGWSPPHYYAYKSIKGDVVMEGRYFIDTSDEHNITKITFIETFFNTPKNDKIEDSIKSSLLKLKKVLEET